MSTLKGPIKRGTSLLAPRLVTAISRRPSVTIESARVLSAVLICTLFLFVYCIPKYVSHKSGDRLTLEYNFDTAMSSIGRFDSIGAYLAVGDRVLEDGSISVCAVH